jgi:hypothetical protein
MAAVWRLWHLYGIQIFDSITAPFIVSTILLIAGIVNVLGWTEAGVAVRIAVSATLILALVVMAVLILPDLRRIAVPLNSGRFNKGQ